MNQLQKDRIWYIVWVGMLLCIASVLLISTIFDGVHFYTKPSDLNQSAHQVHMGGMVVIGSLNHQKEGYFFDISDGEAKIPVNYQGILPPIFREGQQVVVVGRQRDDLFIAERVYAKHDEYYRVKTA